MRTLFAFFALSSAVAAQTIAVSTADHEYIPGSLNQESHDSQGNGNLPGATAVGNGGASVWDFYVGTNLPPIASAVLVVPEGNSLGWPGGLYLPYSSPVTVTAGGSPSTMLDIPLLPSAIGFINAQATPWPGLPSDGWFPLFTHDLTGSAEVLIGSQPALLVLTPAPEPSTICLITGGAIALLLIKRLKGGRF
jgi:hypothetical protein